MTPHTRDEWSIFRDERPPIAWHWWQRVRRFGGVGVVASAIVVAIEFLIADIPGERAFSEASPGGAVSLWPMVLYSALLCPLGGVAIALLLPLYRYRYGGAAVGALIALLCIGLGAALPSRGDGPVGSFERWQAIAGILGLIVMSAALGVASRDEVLGITGATDSSSWHGDAHG